VKLAVDTSALMAILFAESDAEKFLDALEAAQRSHLSCLNLHEAQIVALGRLGEPGVAQLHEIVENNRIELEPFGVDATALAFEAVMKFGKGRHRAGLNMADCAAYALAKGLGAPLLFKGEDFRLTDITAAL
jgi:ribonuclease VapC